jgi:Tetratricopeptide repeat
MRIFRVRLVALFLMIFCVSGTAFAQKGKDDARRFFNAGQKAFKAGRYAEAAKAFEEAFRIKPHPAPLINAGDAWEKAGDVAVAARIYQRVLSLEQAGEQDRADATERLAKITPRIGIFELQGDASMRARVDQDEFHGGDRVYVEVGAHEVTLLDVDGAKRRKFEVTAGASRTIELQSLLPDTAEPKGEGGAAAAGGNDEPGRDQGPPKKGGVRPTTLLLFGVTAVATGGAVYFGLKVNSAEKSYNDQPNRDDLDRFNKNKLLTNVCIGVAGASAIVGTIFLIGDLKRKPTPEQASRSHFRLDAAPTSGGAFVSASGAF